VTPAEVRHRVEASAPRPHILVYLGRLRLHPIQSTSVVLYIGEVAVEERGGFTYCKGSALGEGSSPGERTHYLFLWNRL
jgi:hypothetical protein